MSTQEFVVPLILKALSILGAAYIAASFHQHEEQVIGLMFLGVTVFLAGWFISDFFVWFSYRKGRKSN